MQNTKTGMAVDRQLEMGGVSCSASISGFNWVAWRHPRGWLPRLLALQNLSVDDLAELYANVISQRVATVTTPAWQTYA